jgi:pyruvate dehydrogenase E2 component (dihydrolipoamide acetyltransferase)
MATNVILPALGMAQDSGTIVQWLKAEGDQVRQGEPVAEIQTDKVTVELEAPATGTLAHISAHPGDEVPVGQVIAHILEVGEAVAPPAPDVPSSARSERPPAIPAGGRSPASETNRDIGPSPNGKLLASPKARRLAAERGLDLAELQGSGSGGVILAADVVGEKVAAAPRAAATFDGAFGRSWRLMAERTSHSWTTIPHFYLMREVQADSLVAWRGHLEKLLAVKLTYTDLLIKIIAQALTRHPRLNAGWVNDVVVANPAVNIGLVVAVPDGLLVPVISHADELGIGAIAEQRADLVERAHRGKLRPEDLQGGTFTVSNLGMYGIEAFNAIINAPQVAVLAVGALTPRIVPVNGQPGVAKCLTLSLSCDHRVVDGARGAEFLATIAELIASPPGFEMEEEAQNGR